MAEADWTALTSPALGTAEVARGVTNAFTRPYGGGNFCFGFRSVGSDVGVAGYAVNLANFNPIASGKGASISCAIKKYSSGASYCPMFGLIRGLAPSTAEGYLMGLTEGSSFHIAAMKGAPSLGMQASSDAILPDRLSTSAFSAVSTGDDVSAWFHLKMDIIVNPHSEVHLKFYRNIVQVAHDAAGGPVNDPTWLAIAGMDDFIDDSIGALTGSLPHTDSFWAVFCHYTSNQPGAISLFDHFTVARQTSP